MTRLESSSIQELPVVYLNGKRSDLISVYDRAFQYGDGLFETVAVVNGKPALLELHLQRLKYGLSRLAFPDFSFQPLIDDIEEKSRAFDLATLKLVVTRGESQRGYLPSSSPDINMLLVFSEKQLTESISRAASLCFCETRLGLNPLLAGIKHLNRLEQVLAKKESHDRGYDDGLVADIDGNIIEATSANLFLWKTGKLMTSDLSRCGIAGVVRQLVFEIAEKMHMPVEVVNMSKTECKNADALFLTNSLNGITPVNSLEDVSFDPGKWPKDLYSEVMKHVYT
ncbi:MAG: aminodeoxychorismate lyase [Gammaproteobacteria bacterium]|nr:aminodeoxychorismate lyase [Gammaproteobacteria bacterium]NNJ91051.1 aminodeoxychorismate lyase [Gammaproteobacteria bacterium]